LRLVERQVAVGDLRIGMYVCRLDRDWEGTPFLLQGVLIESEDDIAQLAALCKHVFVDIEQGLAPAEAPRRAPVRTRRASRDYAPADIEQLRSKVAYADTASIDEEMPHAREAQQAIVAFATRMLEDVREGRAISPDDVHDAVEPMVRSILRNADAYLWIEHLRQRGSYDYNHALNCSALAAAFGRHIGFPEDVLTDMASGGLLLDIGKLRVNAEILAREGALTEREIAQVREHVGHCLDILDQAHTLPAHVRDMIGSHHERNDGSGYPAGLSGSDIPLLARIAGVIDSYDAMVSERSYRKAIGKHEALQELYRQRGALYAAEIVEQFMQCMGVYPTGSLVELSSGEVAVVMGQNPARRLRPKLMLLTDPDKTVLAQFRSLDLMVQAEGDAGTLRITGMLEPGAYGLDPTELYL
jgi:HD-GYP domain-containing protein (c-di-GMP phosphodiesterase class II)